LRLGLTKPSGSGGFEPRDEEIVYLFSSNIRPLYAQDILNVLASPAGTSYTFRYEKRYVAASLGSRWGQEVVGRKALVHFSLQQEARYQDPVFFPIRLGYVYQVDRLGEDIFLLHFVLERLVSLKEPTDTDKYGLASAAHAYRTHLRDMIGEANLPYQAAVSMGRDITVDPAAPLDAASDEIQLFDRTARYLTRTESFRQTWFFHVLGFSERDDQPLNEVRQTRLNEKEHLFSLVGGRTYQLNVLQRQPREVSQEATFSVAADDDVLRVVGRKGFTIGSRYDRILVPIHAIEPPGGESRTVVIVRPDEVPGPIVNLPVRVTPSPAEAGAAAATGVSLLLLGLLSFQPDAPVLEKAMVVVAAVFVHLFARGRLLIASWRGRKV
jgi:hypothetical protein